MTSVARLIPLFTLPVALNASGELLRTIPDLRQASNREQYRTEFDITATLTFTCNRRGGSMTMQDKDNAISFWYHADADPTTFRRGDRIRVRGRIEKSKHLNSSPAIVTKAIERIGRNTALTPTPVNASDLSNPTFCDRFVSLSGVLNDAVSDDIDSGYVYLVLDCGESVVYVTIPGSFSAISLDPLIGAHVTIDGIVPAKTKGHRKIIRPRLTAQSTNSIHVVSPAVDISPFNAPSVNTRHFTRSSSRSPNSRCTATGTVLAHWDSQKLLLCTDDRLLIRGELIAGPPPSVGSRILLAGITETDLFSIILTRAKWKLTGGPALQSEEPTDVTSTQLCHTHAGVPRYDFDFHGKVVRLTGVVRGLPVQHQTGQLYIECDGALIAIGTDPAPSAIHNLVIGDKISVCGLCVMETEKMSLSQTLPKITGYRIIIRSADDIRVLAHPSWWTPSRLIGAICVLGFALCGIAIWNRFLSKIIRRRSQELLKEQLTRIESELKVDERTRLSVELHDTLSQNLLGASMEINTAEQLVTEEDALQHLRIASKTLRASRDELRNCLWDLRSQALEEPDMNAAIRKTLEPYVSGIDLQIRFNVPRSILTDNTAHALMRIIRELVLNAIRHGRAQMIKIAGSREAGDLLFSVRDNGLGFDPETAPGISQGHFGLQGVRERLRMLKGSVTIESTIGKGTKVTARFTLPTEEGTKA